MASYIDDALVKDEKISYRGYTSFWVLSPLIIAGFLLLPVYGAGLIFWLAAFVRYKTTEFAVTNKRVIARFGFISRKTFEIDIDTIVYIQVHQDILGSMFNYGSLEITGTGYPQTPITSISNPLNFRDSIFEMQNRGRQKSRR